LRIGYREKAMTARLLALTIALLGGGASAQTLEFWTMQLSPHLDGYVKGLLKGFEAEHPGVKVKWVDLPWSEMERKVLTAIAARQAPDVVNLNPHFAAKLAEFKALVDPAQYLSDEVRKGYLPAAWAANQMDGRTFAVPWYLSVNLTLLNRSLFTKAGVQTAPRTYPELLAMAPRFKALGSFAYFPALDGSHPLETLVAFGVPLTRLPCGPGFASPQGAKVFEFYRSLYQQRWVPRNVVTEGHRKAIELFVAGELAMVSTGMQFLNFIKTSNAPLYAQVDVAPPMGAPSVPPNLAVMNLAVPEQSKHPALAFALAAWVTSPANQLQFARTVPVLPSTRVSYADPFLSTVPVSQDLIDRARALSAATALGGAVQVPPMRNYNKLRNSFVMELQAHMLGHTTPSDATQNIEAKWSALMGCAS
jgi:putative chitobiose transport system substrate-binding protein